MEVFTCTGKLQTLVHLFDVNNLIDVTIDFLHGPQFIIRTCKEQPCSNRYKNECLGEEQITQFYERAEEFYNKRYLPVATHQEQFCGTKQEFIPHTEFNINDFLSNIHDEPATAVTGTTLVGTSHVTHLSVDNTEDQGTESISAYRSDQSSKGNLTGSDDESDDESDDQEVEDLVDQTFHSAISNITVVAPVTTSSVVKDDEEVDFVLDAFWP